MSPAEPNHDPALSAESGQSISSKSASASNGAKPAADAAPSIQIGDFDSTQLMSLLRHLPEVFAKVCNLFHFTYSGKGLDPSSEALYPYFISHT